MNKNQMWATLAAITAFFSLINTMLVLSLHEMGIAILERFCDFTAVVLAGTIISGTFSALEIIHFKWYEELIDTFVRMAKWTIAFAVVSQLQIAVTRGKLLGNYIPNVVLAVSILYLIIIAAGLTNLFYWTKIFIAEDQ